MMKIFALAPQTTILKPLTMSAPLAACILADEFQQTVAPGAIPLNKFEAVTALVIFLSTVAALWFITLQASRCWTPLQSYHYCWTTIFLCMSPAAYFSLKFFSPLQQACMEAF
jgi:hypothetical protein